MAARKTKSTKADRTELIEALNAIEKEKQISKDISLVNQKIYVSTSTERLAK